MKFSNGLSWNLMNVDQEGRFSTAPGGGANWRIPVQFDACSGTGRFLRFAQSNPVPGLFPRSNTIKSLETIDYRRLFMWHLIKNWTLVSSLLCHQVNFCPLFASCVHLPNRDRCIMSTVDKAVLAQFRGQNRQKSLSKQCTSWYLSVRQFAHPLFFCRGKLTQLKTMQ
jgi:hypothetical protein